MTIDTSRLTNSELLDSTRELLRRSCAVEADLLVHLMELEDRKLYAARAFPSLFAMCVQELGLSEDAASNRITAARLARKFPAVLDAFRSGRVHLAGLRMLSPLLTEANHQELLAQAAGKSRRQLEELVARLNPKPPVPDSIRKLPQRVVPTPALPAAAPTPEEAPQPVVPVPPLRPSVQPLSAETYKVQFTAGRALRDKVQQARDLLRHQVRDGDLATIVDQALDLLIAKVKKERFGVGAKPRNHSHSPKSDSRPPRPSRHIPAAMMRAVHERDGGRCTYVSDEGRRCAETGDLEFDHLEGFARTHVHSVDGITLRCRVHNQYAAEQMYGRKFMEQARRSIRPGADKSELLL